MNRVIKFRAWDGEQMVSPDYIDRDGHGHWKSNSVPVCTGVNSPDALMQFTGLKDLKEVMVYEGDVFEGLVFNNSISRGVVVFEHGEFIVKATHGENWSMGCNYAAERSHIIGNIFASPELLETK